jgi:hypothetical protein
MDTTGSRRIQEYQKQKTTEAGKNSNRFYENLTLLYEAFIHYSPIARPDPVLRYFSKV